MLKETQTDRNNKFQDKWANLIFLKKKLSYMPKLVLLHKTSLSYDMKN